MKLAAVCIFYTKNGEVLFLQRRTNDRTISGFCLPGGKVDIESESLLDGCAREVEEEIGFLCEKKNLVRLGNFTSVSGIDVEVYCYEISAILNVILSDEHIGFYWGTGWDKLPLAGNTGLAMTMFQERFDFIGLDFVFPKWSKYADKTADEISKTDPNYISYWLEDKKTIASKELTNLLSSQKNDVKRYIHNNYDGEYDDNYRDSNRCDNSRCDCGGFCRGLCDKCDELDKPFCNEY